MQVKKFEAPSMKEALEMVKAQLGPDAIILSARDHRSSFGLLNKGSVEVTAAISELQLKKREVAESRIPDRLKESFRTQPARIQKQFIDKSIQSRKTAPALPAPSPRGMTEVRYADIPDETQEMRRGMANRTLGKRVTDLLEDIEDGRRSVEVAGPRTRGALAEERVKRAARQAWDAGQETVGRLPGERRAAKQSKQSVKAKANMPSDAAPVPQSPPSPEISAVTSLKQEIQQLHDVIKHLRVAPTSSITLHPGADMGIPFELSSIYERLVHAGLSQASILPILEEARKSMDPQALKKKTLVDAWVARFILEHTEIAPRPSEGRIHLFVGSSGQGKTSALVKMASHLVIKEKRRVAVLSTDTVKVGAIDQLRIYAQILNVPFGVIRRKEDWDQLLTQLAAFDAILVDFPGVTLKNMEEIDLFRSLLPPAAVPRVCHYVQSVTARDSDAFEMARRYQMANFNDVVFTGLDESTAHGLIYNFQQQFRSPLHSFGTGTLIPEDFEWATRERVVDLIFKISKIRSTERG